MKKEKSIVEGQKIASDFEDTDTVIKVPFS
jgi:hypothetical protein